LDTKTLLKRHYLFSRLDEGEQDSLISQLVPVELKLGDIIINKDDPADYIYFIISGKARVIHSLLNKTVTILTIETGSSLGEGAAVNKDKFVYAVRAAGNVSLLKFPYAAYKTIIDKKPELKELLLERFEFLERNKFLWGLDLFSSLTLPQKNKVIENLHYKKLRPGETLFKEGEVRDFAAIIFRGKVKLVKDSLNKKLLIKAKPGDVIGESALLHDAPSFESAVAETDSEVFCFYRKDYSDLSGLKPEVAAFINLHFGNRNLQYDTLLASETVAATEKPSIIIKRGNIKSGIKVQEISFAVTNNKILNGVACLASIQQYYGIKLSLKKIIEKQILAKIPDDLVSVSRKLESTGFLTRMVKLNLCQLKEINLPAVVEWENKELCLLYSFTSKEIILVGSEKGLFKVGSKEFVEKWNKKLLTVSVSPDFGKNGAKITTLVSRFVPIMKPFKSLIVSIVVISVLLQVLNLVIPLFSQVIIDKVFVFEDWSLLGLMLIGMVLVTGFKLIGESLRMLLVSHTMRRASAQMIFRFFKHILLLPQKVFLKWRVGDFLTRFSENQKLLDLLSTNIFKVAVDSISILIFLVALLSTNSTLAAYALIFVAGYAVTILFATPILRANEISVFEKFSDTQSFLIESVGNIITVKSMSAEKLFYESGMEKFVAHKMASFKGSMFAFVIGLISSLLMQGSSIVTLGIGARMCLEGSLTTGELIAFSATLGLLMVPLNGLITMWDEIQQIRVSFDRINDVLSLETEPDNNMIITEPLKGHIKLENVSYKYDDAADYVLEDINLEILPGQKVAFVGRSGSGKTTLVNILSKLLEPTKGKIYYDSRDISEVDPPSLRNQIGFVEQQPYLFSGTIRENITLPAPEISFEEMAETAKIAGVAEFVCKYPMEYDTPIGERGMTLSGGQRQRIVIARALINNPSVLILDEATSALDSETERIVSRNLDTMMEGRTTIIIAHRLSTIVNADKIVVVDKGKIIESGTHDELMDAGGLYYYLYQKNKSE